MLLKLIKTRSMHTGSHCELWEINPFAGNRLLCEVFVLAEHLPLELIYLVTVTRSGICFAGRHCVFQWESERQEVLATDYLRTIQASREEIRVEVCRPKPILPGYPEVDYHPKDAPIVLMDDLSEEERPEEPMYEPDYE